jgi:hypothetical protein
VTARPKVQIIRPDDETIEVYVGGREVAHGNYDMFGSNGMGAIEDTARAVARALGADVEDAAEPDPQPYVYRLAWHAGGRYGSCWQTRPTPIEDADSEDEARRSVARATGVTAPIIFLSIEYIDGPC